MQARAEDRAAPPPRYEPPRFRLPRQGDFAAEVMRFLTGEIDAAGAALADPDVLPDHAVHAARRHIKRARSILRLLKPALGKAFDGANGALREAGRSLSTDRDRDVLAALSRSIGEKHGKAAAALEGLAAHRASRNGQRRLAAIEAAETHLASARSRLSQTDLPDDLAVIAGRRYAALYARGVKALAKSREGHDDERLHDLRKRVKDRWHLARLLKNRWPGDDKARVKKLDRLGELLGADHDLAVLAQKLDGESGKGKQSRKAACAVIARRRAKLQKRAFKLADKLFRDDTKRVEKRWRDWAAGQSSAAGTGETRASDAA